MSQFQMLPGATTIGVVCKDGVILASERRLSYGSFVMSKSAKKVFKITDNIGAACAGLVGDMQVLMREASVYATLYSYQRERNPSVKTAAKVIGNLLFQRRFVPYITQTIIGGVDEDGPSIYILDLMGSVIKDKHASVGTGAEIATGVLENEYKDGISIEEGKEIVNRALKAALARDSASGDGVDVLVITKEGIKEESTKF
ncbi:MAG: archaeal proteasome endopeptidase complex subunit beta [Candidatus Bathyarchaeota archaeon]|nr:archaeal proteasome endopeptidase complex subunit beta [Candidatus Bathyarchaeota archaeon]